ncbi:MAG: hypothetical protein ACPLW7_00255, partial [Minisyncoccia bacterium]
KQSLNQGVSQEEIKNTLLNNNWPQEDIDLAFKMVLGSINAPSLSPQSVDSISTKLLSTGELLRNTFHLYKQKFLTLFSIALISSVISIILSLLIVTILQASHLSTFVDWIILFLVSLFIGLIQLISHIALIYALKEDKISIIQAYRNSLANILNVIWISILFSSIVFSLPLVFMMLGFTIKSAFIPLLILSAFLTLIPGLIFIIWFIFSNYVLVIEHIKGIKALMRSREYAKGQVNNIFSREFSVTFLILVPLLIIYFILVLLEIPNAKTIIEFINSILVVPFATAFLYLLYSNIKALKANQVVSEKPKEHTLYLTLAILGMIMMVILPFKVISYLSSELNSMQNKVQESQITSDLSALKVGVQYYYINNNKYPQTLDELFAKYPDRFYSEYIDPIT